MLIHFMSKIKS